MTPVHRSVEYAGRPLDGRRAPPLAYTPANGYLESEAPSLAYTPTPLKKYVVSNASEK